MVFNLKKAAKTAFGATFGVGGEEMDRIVELPMSQLRLELKNAWQEKKFTAEQYDAFVEKIAKVDNLKDQVAIAKAATEKKEVESELDIELNSPAKQLLWAAVLTRLMDASTTGPVAQTKLWKQLTGSMGVHNESIRVSKMLSLSMQNDDVTYGWGQPGSWFYQDPIKNHVNFDLYFSLLLGFEFTRAAEGHEIGHSQLSVEYPDRMKELYEKVKQFIDPRTVDRDDAPPPKMGKKDQVDLAGEVAEWQLIQRAWNSMEDLTVDKFAIDLERLLPEQDFADSLNHMAMILRGYAEILRGDEKNGPPVTVTTNLPDTKDPKKAKSVLDQLREAMEKKAEEEQKKKLEKMRKRKTQPFTAQEIQDIKAGNISVEVAQKMYDEVTRAALLSGYEKNKLFADKDANWERFNVFPEDIRQLVDVSNLPDANGRDAFKYLCDVCSDGPNSIRNLQPQPKDRLVERNGKTVKESYREVVSETVKARNEIIQRIWDVYIKPYADVMINDYKKKIEKKLDQKQQQQQQQNGQGNQQQQNGGGQGQQQQQSGGGSPSSDGQPQGGGGGSPSPDGQPQSGGQQSNSGGGGGRQDKQQDQKNSQSGGGGQDNEPQDMDEDLKDQVKGMGENPHESEEKEQKEGQENDGQGKDGQSQDKQDGQGGTGGDKEAQEQEGQDGQDGQSSDQKNNGKDKHGRGGPGWGQDPSQQPMPMKVGDMKDKSVQNEDMSPEEKEAMKQAAKNMPKVDPNAMSSQAGNQRGVDLAALAKGDYRDFNRRIIELAPIINQRRAAWRQIKEKQRRQILQKSKNLDFLPPDGDIQDRLDRDKMLEAKFKKATGQKMTADDAKKFQDDDIFSTESAIKSISMIDGSGSMPMVSLGNGVSAMDVAMQSAVIDYMAARLEGIPAWIVMWGDKEPIIIASPDMPLKQVGENVETYREGTSSGTSLRPGLEKMIGTAADYRTPPGTISGSLHITVYSDGDIGDYPQTVSALDIIATNAKNLSVDVAVLKPDGAAHTRMEDAFETVIERSGNRYVGVMRGSDPQEIARDIGKQQLRRVRSFTVKSEPDTEQRRRLRQLHNKLTG